VTNATDAASRAGISSTPTVIVDGKPLPQAQMSETVQEMQDAIEKGLS